MARVTLTDAQKEEKKLQRRAAKKAKRKLEKVGVVEVETTGKKTKASKSALRLIEVSISDAAAMKKLGELREAGVAIKQVAFASDHFIYEVPAEVTGFSNYSTVVSKDKAPAEKPMKTLADLMVRVESDKNDNVKMNKRYVKLLVRGSALKRNEKADAVAAIIKKFKIK